MDKSEFVELLNKYEVGKCEPFEEELLFRYCEKVQTEDIFEAWGLSKEEELRLRIFKNINSEISKTHKRKNTKRKVRHAVSVAAVLIALVALGQFYSHYINFNEAPTLSEESITLQINDGTTKVLKQSDSLTLYNKNGNQIGIQKGNRLVLNNKNDSKILSYNTLTVPNGRQFEVVLSDGTTAHLNSGSSIKFPLSFSKLNSREVFVSGEAYMSVAKNENKPFVVHTGEMNIRVLGTQFNVLAYPEDDTSEVVLVEGSVGMYNSNEGFNAQKTTMLRPGHKATFDRESKNIAIKPAIVEVYTAWRKGELVFRNMAFENLIKKLERHYDVVIVNNNESLLGTKFNASFKQATVEEVLDGLQNVYGITYEIKDEKIIIQ